MDEEGYNRTACDWLLTVTVFSLCLSGCRRTANGGSLTTESMIEQKPAGKIQMGT